MDIIQITALGIIGAVLSVTLKRTSPEMSLMVSVVTGILIFIGVLNQFSSALTVIKQMSATAAFNENYITVILKVLGISYIAQFGMDICKDAGETAISSKIELAGKILIMTVSIPVIIGVMEVITKIL